MQKEQPEPEPEQESGEESEQEHLERIFGFWCAANLQVGSFLCLQFYYGLVGGAQEMRFCQHFNCEKKSVRKTGYKCN